MSATVGPAPPEVVRALAPDGTLRAAINFGNPILANRHPATGEPVGVSVDLARELARRLGVKVELVQFNAAGKVVEAVSANEVAIAFVAIDPERAVTTVYTAPYVVIEGAYLVREGSPLRANEEVDRDWDSRGGGERQRLRPLSFARAEEREDRSRDDVAGGDDTFIAQNWTSPPASSSSCRWMPHASLACVCCRGVSWRSIRPWVRRDRGRWRVTI